MERDRVRAVAALLVLALGLALAWRYATRAHDGKPAPPPTTTATTPTAKVEADGSVEAMASGALGVIAVGEDGLVLRLRKGSDWQREAPVKVALHGVAQQLEEAIAVGDDGTVLELDHDAWRLAPKATTRALRAVAYTSYGAIAVGDGGTILRRAAPHEPWRAEPSGTSNDLLGACAGLRDVWIVGRAGTIVTHAGLADLGAPWKVHPSVTSATLSAVGCDGDHAAAAVGDKGTLLERLDDVGWHETPSGTTSDLRAIAAPMGTHSWLVAGAGGVAMRESGSAEPLSTGAQWDVRAATDGALGTFLGGEGGVLRVGH